MPLYEYECGACGRRFEVIRKFSDPPEEKCPNCGGPVHKMQSAPAFQFKGTGWYVTDYAKSGQAEGKDGRKSDSKTDSKETTKDAGSETAAKSDTTAASTSASPAPATGTSTTTKTGDS